MRYSFADCELDTDRHELKRGGEVVGTRPKVYQVLCYLIEQRARVVPKDELLDACWPGRVVGDATLNSVLKEIRQAIGDSGRRQRYVKTLHGQGYRFVAEIEELAGDPEAEPRAATVPPARSEREYKQVSLLACRVANAGNLAETIGPEEMDAMMRGFFASAKSVLERYGGTVTQWEGDGFTALFGAPRALEDHARRAALAALEIRESMPAADVPVELTAALHTGEVVVGNLDESEQLFTAFGATTRVAHGIRDAAGSGVLASAEFGRLIETEFECREMAAADGAPGIVEISGLKTLHGGVPRRGSLRRSRFVGRDDEIAFIRKRLEIVKDNGGQVVCISGDPGIGKSRLLYELRRSIDDSALSYSQANCLAYRQSSPYFPLQQLLRNACDLSPADDRDTIAQGIGRGARGAGLDEHTVGLLLALLDAGDGEPDVSGPGIETIFSGANRLILRPAAGKSLVVAIEDLHWLDTTSEQWLAAFVQRIATLPVLLLVTYRPGYRADWLSHSHVTQLALPRLSDSDSAALVGSLASGLPDSPEVWRRIVGNAQGNPFFLEELTFNLTEVDGADAGSVPTTVQAVLGSRIDQLEAVDKAVLQSAAVIGATVPHAVLAALEPDTDIDATMRRLEHGEFLFEEPTTEHKQYLFKHALTRDVAYQSLLSGTRRRRHSEIGEIYEASFPESVTTQPEVLAHHFSEAGDAGKAAVYWKKAGIRAAERFANPEAAAHFERAIEAGEALPQTAETKLEQLDTFLRIGPPLMASKAFTSPAVEASYLKARQLCDDVGTDAQLLTVLWGLWLHYAHRGRIGDARPLARQIVEIAENVDDDGLRLQAHHAMWTTEIWHGDLQSCYEHSMAGVRLYDPVKHASHKFLFGGHDPGVCARGTAAIAAWFLGRPQQCIDLTREGEILAGQLDHPYSRIITMHDFMEIETLRGNADIAGRYGRMAIDACTEHRVPNYLVVGHIFAGFSAAACGDLDTGMAELKDGLQRYRDLGAERNLAPYLLLLAELCRTPALCEEGLAAVDEAAELISRTGEIRWQPEITRCRGELLLLQSPGNEREAERLFRGALQIAAAQGCLAFELRAATSLARLMQGDGRVEEAQQTLKPVYDRFEEGFDTRDLREAGALLDALG